MALFDCALGRPALVSVEHMNRTEAPKSMLWLNYSVRKINCARVHFQRHCSSFLGLEFLRFCTLCLGVQLDQAGLAFQDMRPVKYLTSVQLAESRINNWTIPL